MELGPPKPSADEFTPSDDKKETKKSKKRDAGKLGAFAVEAKPSQPTKKATSPEERLDTNAKTARAEQQLAKNEQSLSDKAPELNGEAPLEHLSEVESRAANQELARNRRAELAGELADAAAASPAADQAVAAEAFLAKAELTGDPAAAAAEILAGLEIEPVGESDDLSLEAGLEAAETVDQPLAGAALERVIDPHQTAEGDLPLNYYEAEADSATASATLGGPTPPRRPTFGAGPVPPFGAAPYPNFNAPRAATAGALTNPNAISTEEAYYSERRVQLRGLLVGGIVGYLIGRRRGRIKTEKRLLPVQNKLEKEVQSLQANLLEKEIVIRQASAEKRRAALSPASERLITIAAEQKRWQAAESQPAAFKLPPERIGHVLMTVERGRAVPGAKVELPAGAQKLSIEKQVATMPRAELLAVSEKIAVEGTTLRQIYETHLVGERGLRRLVMEHLSGGDVPRALRRELVEREIDFERDPILRDRARASLAGAGKSALNSLVQQAGAIAVMPDDVPLAAEQAIVQLPAASSPLAPRHRLAGIVLVSTIAVLLAFIVFLLATGR